jgi:hypothetical protein
MARRPLADDPPLRDRINRWKSAIRRGAEAFRDELNKASGAGVEHAMGNSPNEDAYAEAASAIARMEYIDRGGRAPAIRVEKRAREAAIEFIESLGRLNIPAPSVGPSPDHGVAMSWTFNTPEGELEIDVVFLDWYRIEYREGFAERDGFSEQTILDSLQQLRERLLRAMDAAQHAA